MSFGIAGVHFTTSAGIVVHHDVGLVALSFLVAACGSYASLDMIERWRHTQDGQARYWQTASSVTLGGSIWSMHFVGMLALEMDMPMSYALAPTLLSLLIAIGSVACALEIIQTASFRRIACGGLTLGLGVAAMHYIGMSAMRFSGSLAYTPGLWGLSLLVGVAAATAALWLSIHVQEMWHRAVAALVMGVAICGMHYVGMASTVFRFDPLMQVVAGLPTGPIAITISLVALALSLCTIVCVAADRLILASAQHEAVRLQQSNDKLARANAELEVGRQQFRLVLENIAEGITFFDKDQKLIVSNQHYSEIYRLTADQTRVGTSLFTILDHRLANGTLQNITQADFLSRREALSRAGRPYDLVDELRDGRTIAMHYQPLPNGGWLTMHGDITDRRRAEEKLEFMAGHDALTRLANRVLFQDRLEQAIALAGRGTEFALICLDLDNFKSVNDILGHPVGDGLLKAVAARLQACVREGDTLARLGGDEFAIIQLAIEQPQHAQVLADRILGAFHDPFDIEGHQIMAGISIGVALAPGDGASSEPLIKNADIALYLAKAEGRGTVRFFEPEMDARIQLRRTLELDLRDAIARDEFELYYQPLVNLAGGRITGFEALLRWHHPIRGLVSPADFIPVAEETGMIVAIGEWVLRMACFEAENWPADISIAVNLSTVQFRKGDLVATVQAALEASGLQPSRLELEITESVLLHDSVGTLMALRRLRAMGIAVALDDFGTGYSSLSYLRSFPFDKIKIDQSFVRDLVKNKESMSIIRAVTGLGHSLNLKVTAEGVETLEQLNKLREEGCTEVQGYFFSRPRPANELPALIKKLQQIGNRAIS